MNANVKAVLVALAVVASSATSAPAQVVKIDWAGLWTKDQEEAAANRNAAQPYIVESEGKRKVRKVEAAAGTVRGVQAGFDKAASWAKIGIEIAKKGSELLESYEKLSPEDASYEPDYSPAGMPQIPSRCLDSLECQDCFARSHDELTASRRNLERLRSLHLSTKNYVERAKSLGDSTSTIHVTAGLQWQAKRREIEASFVSFEQSYDRKYEELIQKLHDTLQRLGQCEAAHLGDEDWYNRYGFMYFQFMEARYRR